MGGATHGHLRQLARAVIFSGRQSSSLVSRANVLPVGNASSRQIADAMRMQQVDLNLADGANLARELVAAALLAAKTRRPGPAAEQWARGLLVAALFQYREIDGCLEVEGAEFALRWLDLYTQMLDLLAAWKMCSERDQTTAAAENHSYDYSREVGDEVQGSTYQQRFMSCLPGWSSSAYRISADCEHNLVFASFVTLALMTKLRYRLLRGLDADNGIATGATGTGALASIDGSLLNLRNVSLPEAAFLRIVGQAGQGTPFNRIHLRLAWARIGCSPAQAQSIGRTIDNLHAYPDHLLTEAERCFSQSLDQGSKEEKGVISSTDAHTLVPSPLLVWIGCASTQALRRFRDGLSSNSSISVHAILPELLAAITRRLITISQQQETTEEARGRRGEADADILSTLHMWVALDQQSGPHGNDALAVLDHFQEAADDSSYAAAWSTMRRCQPDQELEAHFQRWLRHLWAQKQYNRVVALHRTAVRLLSEKHAGDGGYASRLTQICLELHTQDPAGGANTQRILHNLLSVGIEPSRQVWRQWMRVKLMASEFQNAVRALWRYKTCKVSEREEGEDFGEDACIYLAARLSQIGADKGVMLEDILFDISRAVSIGLIEADCERLHMLREAGATPLTAAAAVISLHEQLATHVCESPARPNRLKVAAAVHMHLLHCLRVQDLTPDLAARVSRLEETIVAVFWRAGRNEQIRMLCRQRYDTAWPALWMPLPLVKSQKLVRAWLANVLAERQLTGFDLGGGGGGDCAAADDLGAYLAVLIEQLQQQQQKEERADDGSAKTNAAVMKFLLNTQKRVKAGTELQYTVHGHSNADPTDILLYVRPAPATEQQHPSPGDRSICERCQADNPRFATYCPFCQISTAPDGVLPPEGLRLPPATGEDANAGADTSTEVTHHLSAEDTIMSLSLMYRVPASVLRRHNRLPTDGLVAGRKTVAIPRSHYSGKALSREPDAEEEERKKTLRRWMVATKCAEYEVGVVYLRANGYSLDRAVDAYRGDEQWERENPIKGGWGRVRR
ncbi:hypothetical protein DV735_g4066, partial [Chaetothyriales sp. CBS 134920]